MYQSPFSEASYDFVGVILNSEHLSKIDASLNQWFKTPQGCRVAQAFEQQLRSAPYSYRGRTSVQLGLCGENPWLSQFQFKETWLLGPEKNHPNITLVSSFEELPFDKNSIDCVIAPLTLETSRNTHHVLDEIDRVLKPMQHVIFFGVNPWSFWGIFFRWRSATLFQKNHKAKLISLYALKRYMFHRGYRQCAISSFYYLPPVKNKSFMRCLAFLDQVGKMIKPYPSGFYCVILQKYEKAFIPWGMEDAHNSWVDQKASLNSGISYQIDSNDDLSV